MLALQLDIMSLSQILYVTYISRRNTLQKNIYFKMGLYFFQYCFIKNAERAFNRSLKLIIICVVILKIQLVPLITRV